MWIKLNDKANGSWKWSPEGLNHFVRQCVYARLLKSRSKIVRNTEVFNSIGPLKVSGPELVSVETDFDWIQKNRDEQSRHLHSDLLRQINQDGKLAFAKLTQMRSRMRQDGEDLRTMQLSASKETINNVERAVSNFQMGKEIAENVRDLSATTLVVGATFLSGGASAAVLGGGSTLKGVGKYQVSGNIGAGVLEASGTFVVGLISFAPVLSGGGKAVSLAERVAAQSGTEKVVLMLVGAQTDAGFEVGKSMIDGASAKEAFAKGGIRFLTDVTTGGAGMKLDAITFLSKTGLPVAARLLTDSGMAVAADKAVNLTASQSSHIRVAPHLAPVHDCHTSIPNAHSDEAYIRTLVMRPA